MSIHTAVPIEDGRKRVHRDGAQGIERTEFLPLRLSTPLGLWVKTMLWADVEEMIAGTGGPAVGWTRKFAKQHITMPVCSALVERRFPGFVVAATSLLEQEKGRPLSRSESVEFKLYRTIHSGYADRSKEDPNERFGPNKGKRHWNNQPAMNNLMKTIQNLLLTHGPLLSFDYDISNPYQVPEPK